MKRKIKRILEIIVEIQFIAGLHMMSASAIAWVIGATGNWWLVGVIGSVLCAIPCLGVFVEVGEL